MILKSTNYLHSGQKLVFIFSIVCCRPIKITLWLMLANATWATVVVRKDNKSLRLKFHRYSLFVWLVWLIPYSGGMIMAMS